jgi:hypothetical protein
MMDNSKTAVFPEPVGDETTMLSEWFMACVGTNNSPSIEGAHRGERRKRPYRFEALTLDSVEDSELKEASVPVSCERKE